MQLKLVNYFVFLWLNQCIKKYADLFLEIMSFFSFFSACNVIVSANGDCEKTTIINFITEYYFDKQNINMLNKNYILKSIDYPNNILLIFSENEFFHTLTAAWTLCCPALACRLALGSIGDHTLFHAFILLLRHLL